MRSLNLFYNYFSFIVSARTSRETRYYTVNFLASQEKEAQCVTVGTVRLLLRKLNSVIGSDQWGNVTTSIRGSPSQNSPGFN